MAPFAGRSSTTRLPAISELQRTTNFCPSDERLLSTLNHMTQYPPAEKLTIGLEHNMNRIHWQAQKFTTSLAWRAGCQINGCQDRSRNGFLIIANGLETPAAMRTSMPPFSGVDR